MIPSCSFSNPVLLAINSGELKIDNEFQLWATKVTSPHHLDYSRYNGSYKGDVIEESFAYKSPYYQNYPSLSQFALAAQLGTVTLEIYSTDDKNAPVWCKSEDGREFLRSAIYSYHVYR